MYRDHVSRTAVTALATSVVLAFAMSLAHARPPARPKVLVTAFEPWDGATFNPSWTAVRHLNGKVLQGFEILALELPVDVFKVDQVLSSVIRDKRPVAYIAFGRGRDNYEVELIADNAITPAMLGHLSALLPASACIRGDGRPRYSTTLPARAIVTALSRESYPATFSVDAGDYVCEYTFYLGRYLFQKNGLKGPMGFIHVPTVEHAPGAAKLERAADIVVETVLKSLPKQKQTGLVDRLSPARPERAK
jgi:pyroglutamyl-peptidase